MPAWTRICVRVPAASTGVVEDCLLDCGAVSVTLLAADEEELFARHGQDAPLWAHCRVEGLFEATAAPDDASPGAPWREVVTALSACCPEAEIVPQEQLADRDWESQFRQFAVDECFGDRLRLAPRGASVSPPPLVTLQLDPGMAFGTGSHPTTRLCLDWIAGADITGRRVLDFGCGSGVLAIAMALLGAGSTDAVDIDPQAVLATRDNAGFNGVDAARLRVCATPDFQPAAGGYEVIIANILLNPLIELAPLLTGWLAKHGVLVLSGVLAGQRQALIGAYPDIVFDVIAEEDGWLRAQGRHRG